MLSKSTISYAWGTQIYEMKIELKYPITCSKSNKTQLAFGMPCVIGGNGWRWILFFFKCFGETFWVPFFPSFEVIKKRERERERQTRRELEWVGFWSDSDRKKVKKNMAVRTPFFEICSISICPHWVFLDSFFSFFIVRFKHNKTSFVILSLSVFLKWCQFLSPVPPLQYSLLRPPRNKRTKKFIFLYSRAQTYIQRESSLLGTDGSGVLIP